MRESETLLNMDGRSPLLLLTSGKLLKKKQSHSTMFSNQSLSFIVYVTFWPRLDELEPMYRIKTMTTTH